MRWIVIAAVCVVGTSLASCASAGREAARVDWQDLRPPTQAAEANPFVNLSDEQLDALRRLVVSREFEARGIRPTEVALQQRVEAMRQLAAQGIDADALLARRTQVIAQRRAEAEAGMPALQGQGVRLTGYLVPTAASQGRVTEFLLVPWVGACSHAERPPPNQVLRVRPAQPYANRGDYYEPVEVSGALQLQLVSTQVFMGDGSVDVRSAYAIDGAAVTALSSAPRNAN